MTHSAPIVVIGLNEQVDGAHVATRQVFCGSRLCERFNLILSSPCEQLWAFCRRHARNYGHFIATMRAIMGILSSPCEQSEHFAVAMRAKRAFCRRHASTASILSPPCERREQFSAAMRAIMGILSLPYEQLWACSLSSCHVTDKCATDQPINGSSYLSVTI
jgi:hypothetical protein